MLLFASAALAQSTASFPEPAGSAPVRKAEPAPAPQAPPARAPAPVPAPQPVRTPVNPAPVVRAPVAQTAPRVEPAPPVDSTTDRRYPTLPAPAPQRALPPLRGSGFYPAILPYRDGIAVPPGYRVEHRSSNGLIGGGLVALIASYGTALIVGAGDHFENGTGWTLVPVIGPLAAVKARSYHCDNSATDVITAQVHANACVKGAFNQAQTIAILSADAVVQATGAVLLIVGLVSGHDELVRADVEVGVRVAPRAVGENGFGLGFDARF